MHVGCWPRHRERVPRRPSPLPPSSWPPSTAGRRTTCACWPSSSWRSHRAWPCSPAAPTRPSWSSRNPRACRTTFPGCSSGCPAPRRPRGRPRQPRPGRRRAGPARRRGARARPRRGRRGSLAADGPRQARAEPDGRVPLRTLVLGVLLVSVGAILVRLAAAPPLAVSFYRMSIASLLLSPFAWSGARRSWPTLSARPACCCWPPASRWRSISPPGSRACRTPRWPPRCCSSTRRRSSRSGCRSSSSTRSLRSRSRSRSARNRGAAVIALGDRDSSPASLFGNLLAVAGAVTLATYQVIGRGLRATLPLNAYMLAVWGTATLTLAGLMAAFGTRFAPFPPGPGWPSRRSPSCRRSEATASRIARCARCRRRPWGCSCWASPDRLASRNGPVPRDALAGHSRRRCHRPRSTGAGPDATGMRRSGQFSR